MRVFIALLASLFFVVACTAPPMTGQQLEDYARYTSLRATEAAAGQLIASSKATEAAAAQSIAQLTAVAISPAVAITSTAPMTGSIAISATDTLTATVVITSTPAVTVTVDASGAKPALAASAILTASTAVTSDGSAHLDRGVISHGRNDCAPNGYGYRDANADAIPVANSIADVDCHPNADAIPVVNSIADVDCHANAGAIPVANTDGHPNSNVVFIPNADAISTIIADPDHFSNRACACIWPNRNTFTGRHGNLRTPLASTSQPGGDRITHSQTNWLTHLNRRRPHLCPHRQDLRWFAAAR